MKQQTIRNISGWAIIAIAFFSTYLIFHYEGFNLLFSVLLLLTLSVAVSFNRIFTPAMVRASQVILGVLFLFSGFVKAVDPLGTAYRVEDYFIAFGTEWMIPAKIALSFLLNAAELILGFLLLLNIKPKLSSWFLLLMMTGFTLITLNDALNNPVPDCGCFGDAIILTNWQTFYKNLVIDVFVFIIFLNNRRIKPFFKNTTEWSLGIGILVLLFVFQYLNYINLPMMDFRPWKTGNKMISDQRLPVKYYLKFENVNTGETQEYLSPDYPYNDPEWTKNWKFISQRTEDPNKVPGMDLSIINFDGEDVTRNYLENPDFNLMVVAWDLNESNEEAFEKINQLYQKAEAAGIELIVLTSTLEKQINELVKANDISPDIPFFNADDIVLKTMVRANPGILLMKNGTVIDKWHYRNLPPWEEIEKLYINTQH